MAYRVLILGASYGSLLGTKLAMAGHDVTLVCRGQTAELINREGTEVHIRLRGEDAHRAIRSGDLPGRVTATAPEDVDPSQYALVSLAMQEPQYSVRSIRDLLGWVAAAKVPCLSIMNMPPLPYLWRLPGIDASSLESAFADARVWDGFEPGLVTLCSPDPQAFRPPGLGTNVLHVGLPTNFKATAFDNPAYTAMLRELEADIAAVQLGGEDVPVKLKVFDSLFVPLAKWSMLLTGNYRCVLKEGVRSIREAVHDDIEKSRGIYAFVDELARRLGADSADQVPFEKYASAAESLLKPSSAARAIAAGSTAIERVDRLVQMIGAQLEMQNDEVDATVSAIDSALKRNQRQAA